MKTEFLKPGIKVIYHGHLKDSPMSFHKKDDVILINIFQLKCSDKITQKVGYSKVAAEVN